MDDNIFERAKQSMSLVDFLVGFLGEQPVKAGQNFRFKVCPHCGPDQTHLLMVFDGDRYYCHRCEAKGTIIDAAMVAQGFTNPLDAAKFLTGDNTMSSPNRRQRAPQQAQAQAQAQAPQQNTEDVTKVLKGILKISAKTLSEVPAPVMQYLTEVRGFSETTIQEAINRKFLLVTVGAPRLVAARIKGLVGEDVLSQAGFMGDKGVKIIPYRPLVFPLAHKKSVEFRLARAPRESELKSISKGSRDHDLWYWKADGSGNTNIIVCEGTMDMLAAYEMGFRGHIFGLPGAKSFGDGTALVKAVKAVSDEKSKIYLAFDADAAGQSAFRKLSDIFTAANLPHLRMTYDGESKDLNESLLHRKRTAAVPTTAPAVVVAPAAPAPAAAEPAPAVSVPQEPVVAPAHEPAKAKQPRKKASTPRKPKTKKVEVPTSFFGRVKLAAKLLFGKEGVS